MSEYKHTAVCGCDACHAPPPGAGARPDLSTPRPWKAEPEDPRRPEGPWRVVGPGRYGSTYTLVATRLSESDARCIARAPHMQEVLEDIAAQTFEDINRAPAWAKRMARDAMSCDVCKGDW